MTERLLPKAIPFDPQGFAAKIEQEMASLAAGEFNLNRGYAHLAGMLVRFKTAEVWREIGHSSFNSYLLSLQERYGRSAKQLYVYISAAEQLLSVVGEADLDRMGITRAEALARASKKAGKPVTRGLLAAALDDKVSVSELRGLAYREYNLPAGELPKGNWQDFGGAFLEPHERAIFTEAVKITARVLGLSKDLPDWIKRKKIILAWAQEFSGTYAAEVYGEGMGGDRRIGTGDQDIQIEEGSSTPADD